MWIHVKDKLPPTGKMVLFWDGWEKRFGWYVEDGLWRCTAFGPYYKNITHWLDVKDPPMNGFFAESEPWYLVRPKAIMAIYDNKVHLIDICESRQAEYIAEGLNELLRKGILKFEDDKT